MKPRSGAVKPRSGAVSGSPLLSVRDLHHWFGGLHVIDGVSFACAPGMVKAIIGPNGAGKTTLFNLIAGNLSPVSGSILLDGRPTARLKPHQIAARGICRTFQSTRLFPRMTVLENVLVGWHLRGRYGFLAGMIGPAVTGREERGAQRDCMGILDGLGNT